MSIPSEFPRLPMGRMEWEEALTNYYLRIHDDGDAAPIKSFEVTPETLAAAAGLPAEMADEAEQAFRLTIRSSDLLQQSFEDGLKLKWLPTDRVPQCMVPLALSLLVDSLMDEEYAGIGQYRARLRQWLGIQKSFNILRGFQLMWEDLKAWLDARIAEGKPYRPLILPNSPPTWRHIGYTRYLSFPTRRDVRLLERLLSRTRRHDDRHALVLSLIAGIDQQKGVSPGLRSAFEDFRIGYRSGRATADHRFWKLVQRARTNIGKSEKPSVDLRIIYDEDECPQFYVSGRDNREVNLFSGLGQAIASTRVAQSPNLGPAVKRGELFFVQTGIASWSAIPDLPPRGVSLYVALSPLKYGGTSWDVDFHMSGGWRLSSRPVDAGQAAAVLGRLLKNGGLSSGLAAPALEGGVRTGAFWLGRPSYLPAIVGIVGGISLRRTDSSKDGSLVWKDGRLSASGPIKGEYVINASEIDWSRRLRFHPNAVPHAEISGKAYDLPKITEWGKFASGHLELTACEALEWDGRDFPYQEMLEALYAAGRAGLDEGEAVDLIGRVANRQVWDVLRCLTESTFLEARHRQAWRGRVYTLGFPALRVVETSAGPLCVAEGALPLWAEQEFKSTVEANGGHPFRRLGAGPFSPPLIGARGIEPEVLSSRLGWHLRQLTDLPVRAGEDSHPSIKATGQNHEPASVWNWEANRFERGTVCHGETRLVRLVHLGRRDHDFYRVDGRGGVTFHLSRTSAILQAHRVAGRPLFRYAEGRIGRISLEGSLPLEIAAVLRLLALSNPGPTDEGYAYPAGVDGAHWASTLLPIEIVGTPRPAGEPAAARFRLGQMARRPLWINGALAFGEGRSV